MIGLSLSFCIPQILADKVRIEDVELVISDAYFETRMQLEERMDYLVTNDTVWKKNPEGYRAIALALYDDGKLISPRAVGQQPPEHDATWWCDAVCLENDKWHIINSRKWVLSEHGACPGCGDRTYHLMDGDTVLKEKCSSCGWSARTNAWFLSDRNDPEQ